MQISFDSTPTGRTLCACLATALVAAVALAAEPAPAVAADAAAPAESKPAPAAVPSVPTTTTEPDAAQPTAHGYTADTLAAALQKSYENTTSFRAGFTQRFRSKLTKLTQNSSGTLYYRRKGKLRWDYEKGQAKSYISDGAKLWITDRDEKSVFVRENVSGHKLSATLAFLLGEGKLAQDFDLALVLDKIDDDMAVGERLCLELLPKREGEEFEAMYFVIDPASLEVVETVLFDLAGNRNHIRFEKPARNVEFTVEFTFTPPPDWAVKTTP